MYNFYSKIVFTFLLLLITFELKQSYIPHLKVLMCGIYAFAALLCGDTFILCYTNLKLALLLHKTVLINFPIGTNVCVLTHTTAWNQRKLKILLSSATIGPLEPLLWWNYEVFWIQKEQTDARQTPYLRTDRRKCWNIYVNLWTMYSKTHSKCFDGKTE